LEIKTFESMLVSIKLLAIVNERLFATICTCDVRIEDLG
jgi:hypothetical protein